MLSSGLGKYLAPTSLGVGYAIIKIITLRILDSDLAISQDLTYQFLGGILLGFAIRPVKIMIYWKWSTSIVFFSMLLFLGPLLMNSKKRPLLAGANHSALYVGWS